MIHPIDDRRDGGRDEVRRGIMSVGGLVASRTCASFSNSISRSKVIQQKSIDEHLNLKHARHEATTIPDTNAPPIPAMAIQKLSDIIFTICTYYYGLYTPLISVIFILKWIFITCSIILIFIFIIITCCVYLEDISVYMLNQQ